MLENNEWLKTISSQASKTISYEEGSTTIESVRIAEASRVGFKRTRSARTSEKGVRYGLNSMVT